MPDQPQLLWYNHNMKQILQAKQQHWDGMYARPLAEVPWEISEPPRELVEFLQTTTVERGSALDVACGTGNYSFYLAQQGFADVLGVDFSQAALAIAQRRARSLHLPVHFQYADVTQLLETLPTSSFDFILDYSILHHIAPADVSSYAAQFSTLLNDAGLLFLVCYSDKDVDGKTITGKYGNDMFYRTKEEIEKLYTSLKCISYHETHLGKRLHHLGHWFVFQK